MIRTKYDSSIILDTWKGYKCLKEIDPECKGLVNLYINGFSASYVNNYSEEQVNAVDYAIDNAIAIQKLLLVKISNYALENNIFISNLNKQVGLYGISIKKAKKDKYAYTNYIFKVSETVSKIYTLKIFTLKKHIFGILEV